MLDEHRRTRALSRRKHSANPELSSVVPYSGLLNLVWDNVLFLVVTMVTGTLPEIPDQIKKTRLRDS